MGQIISLNPIFENRPAIQKKFNIVVVFVHNFGGNRNSMNKHVELVNQLGFDAVTFDLPFSSFKDLARIKLPIGTDGRFGLRHLWADKIDEVLGSIPQKKIICSFSYPSISALMSISRRHAIDIIGWVSDGGPFLSVAEGVSNLISYSLKNTIKKTNNGLPNIVLKISEKVPMFKKYFSFSSPFLLGAFNENSDIKKYFSNLPMGFSVMAVRSLSDQIISPDMIDNFFILGMRRIDLERITLHDSDHILGISREPELYKQAISNFLISKTKSISN